MSQNLNQARTFTFADISIGDKHSYSYVITADTYKKFLEAYEDFSPVHIDEKYAKSRGFAGLVMHGAILNGFISHFIGMYFPGKFSLLLAVDLRFANPSYQGDTIQLESTVTQKLDSRNILVLDLVLHNSTQTNVAARSRIQVMIKEQM